jgi:antitoxin component of RelBE/YafQ-DinJ toxin-antitoxin module
VLTVRLDSELKGRLAQAAAKLDLSENDVVRHALRAAVNVIEANNYKIELPLQMALAKAPIESHVRGARQRELEYPARKAPINEVSPTLVFLIISSSRNPNAWRP